MKISLSFWGLALGAFRSPNSFISPPKETDLSAHYVKSFVFCFHFFWPATPRSCCCVYFFVWRHIEGFSLNGLQIYAVSTENAFNFRYFDDELQTLHDSQAEGVGK